MTTVCLFWISAVGILYIYLGYPALIGLAARLRPRPVDKGEVDGDVSVIVAVFNASDRIEAKLRTVLSSGAADRIREVLVASDGSSDDTVRRVQAWGDARVRAVPFPERRGKAACLNDAAAQAEGDFLLFTDARQSLRPDAMGALIRNFRDSRVDAVSGELVFTEGSRGTAVGLGVGIYWRYETWIREQESLVHSAPGATGALYMLRRRSFHPIPPGTILDDVAIPMQAVAEGGRCVAEPAAVAVDQASSTGRAEARRKRRTIAGTAQLIRLYPGWLLPRRNPIWFQFLSHKVLRLASPLLLAAAFFSSLALCARPLYLSAILAQVGFYGLAGAGWLLRKRVAAPVVSVPYLFVLLNATALWALLDAVRGRYTGAWERGDPRP